MRHIPVLQLTERMFHRSLSLALAALFLINIGCGHDSPMLAKCPPIRGPTEAEIAMVGTWQLTLQDTVTQTVIHMDLLMTLPPHRSAKVLTSCFSYPDLHVWPGSPPEVGSMRDRGELDVRGDDTIRLDLWVSGSDPVTTLYGGGLAPLGDGTWSGDFRVKRQSRLMTGGRWTLARDPAGS
jgi:hypothetical protein